MSSILIKNIKEIVTMDQERNRLKGYSLLIKDNRVDKIAQEIEFTADQVIDGADYFLYPGLINTHHHFYQTLTRNIAQVQNVELFNWLKYLYPIWARLTPEAVYYSSLVAMGELLKTGCTTSVDQFYVFPRSQPKELLDEEFRAAEEIGIRFHGSRGSMSLGEKDGGLPPDSVVQSEEEILSDSQRVIEKFHNSRPFAMQRVVLAPCSPFSVTENLLRESIKLARNYKVRSHTHLAETKDEEKYCQEIFSMRPLDYMKKVGWLGKDIWFAHGVDLTEREIDLLADTGTGVAHCPVSNQKLASGAANIPYMLQKRVPVGLAVDGSASNDSSNMIAELKAAFLMHRLIYGISSMSAEEVLSMATNGGRDVLNQQEIGSLEEGKAADMFLISSKRLGFAGGLSDPVSALVTSGDSQIVDINIVNGKIVVSDGRLVNIDEEKVIEKANQISQKMMEGK
ncbi:MAG: 8-oxoguanine deaminase [Candidatus Infernicultor aquiphilus]|uniref:8-oxoguanine deaminase n=1 Tax=Candidatus Infernicultor aquiphilus TaxID=1805029 RepID=A0A2M8C992_9BACT|nr:MAG: 8-oxoguanine deaminase [Candidatus Atribacteria bacterium CG_4_9_14_3_um_filter_33_16]